LYVIAVPVRNVNKSGVRTNLATGGHVTFPPYCQWWHWPFVSGCDVRWVATTTQGALWRVCCVSHVKRPPPVSWGWCEAAHGRSVVSWCVFSRWRRWSIASASFRFSTTRSLQCWTSIYVWMTRTVFQWSMYAASHHQCHQCSAPAYELDHETATEWWYHSRTDPAVICAANRQLIFLLVLQLYIEDNTHNSC